MKPHEDLTLSQKPLVLNALTLRRCARCPVSFFARGDEVICWACRAWGRPADPAHEPDVLLLHLSAQDEHKLALLAALEPDEPAQPGPDPGDERPVSPGPDPGPGDGERPTCLADHLALQVLRTGRPVRWSARGVL